MIEISEKAFGELRQSFTQLHSCASDSPPGSGYWCTEWEKDGIILGVEEYRLHRFDYKPKYYLLVIENEDD